MVDEARVESDQSGRGEQWPAGKRELCGESLLDVDLEHHHAKEREASGDGAVVILGAIVRLEGGRVRRPRDLRVEEAEQPHVDLPEGERQSALRDLIRLRLRG